MHQRPARIHFETLLQPFHRTRAAQGHAVLRLRRSARRCGYAAARQRATRRALRASPPPAPRAGCGTRNRCAAVRLPRSAGCRAGAGRHRHRGRSVAGASTARDRRNRRSCTAPATGSCGCRCRAPPRSRRATSRRDRRTGVRRARGAGSGTRTRWCSRLPAFPRTAGWPRHTCCRASMRAAKRYMVSRQVQKLSSGCVWRSARPAIARWNACECRLGMPGTRHPDAVCCASGLATAEVWVGWSMLTAEVLGALGYRFIPSKTRP